MKKKFLLEEALGGDMSEYSDKDWKKLKATREGIRIHVEGGIEPRKIYEVVIEPSFVSKSVKGILDEALDYFATDTTVQRLASHKYELLEGEHRDVRDAIIATLKDNVRHIVGVDSFGSLAVFHGLAQRVEGVDPVHV